MRKKEKKNMKRRVAPFSIVILTSYKYLLYFTPHTIHCIDIFCLFIFIYLYNMNENVIDVRIDAMEANEITLHEDFYQCKYRISVIHTSSLIKDVFMMIYAH